MALSGSNPRIDFRQVTEDRLVEVVALLDYRPHIGRDVRGSLQRFGEFVRLCHPSEGLSRPGVERVGGLVKIVLAVNRQVGSFREVLA